MILAFLKLLGCLGLLMYGMKLLGESLQKMAGNQLRRILDTLTTNRFTSLISGALITAVIQSGSATRHDHRFCPCRNAYFHTRPVHHHGCEHRQHTYCLAYGSRI